MKVRIEYTIEVTDLFRRALRVFHGEEGVATRSEIREHFKSVGSAQDDDVIDAYERWQAEHFEEEDGR